MTLVYRRKMKQLLPITITIIVLKEVSKQGGNTVAKWQSLIFSKTPEFSFSKSINIFGVEMQDVVPISIYIITIH